MLLKSLIIGSFVTFVYGFRSAFDQQLYQNVLDEELCREQMVLLLNHSLGLKFLDSSGKFPAGILSGNLNDLGDYYQCLSIDSQVVEDHKTHNIQGKYCTILLPLNQQPVVSPEKSTNPNATWSGIDWPLKISPETGKGNYPDSRVFVRSVECAQEAMIAVCVPKVCSATQALDFFLEINPLLNVTYIENFCRLPNDKPFVPADYVAIVLFSIIVCLTIVSTFFDLYNTFGIKKPSSSLTRSFSAYTNTRRLLTFNTVSGALECVDGIRAISMMWVVVGHTYSKTLLGIIHNNTYLLKWLKLFSSTWVNSAPLAVDTFFFLSGMFSVYTTIGKVNRDQFMRYLHLFYLNRLLRMFPLLATMVLLEASVFNYISDGPLWQNVAASTENCREYWWSALLHVQNYVNPLNVCIDQTWYLSVDMQLYFICPMVLFFLFGTKIFAWSALCVALALSLISVSIYSFTYNFSAALYQPNNLAELADYMKIYYMNTLTRASPFFIGMIFGYILHIHRGRKIRITKVNVSLLWFLALVLMTFCIFSIYPLRQPEFECQTYDNFLNAYMRSLWAAGLGWIVFACVHGYGGPVNWFLSLPMWKLPARLSYAMYLVHVSIIVAVNSSWVKIHYFTNGEILYRYCSNLLLTFVAAFVMCIFIDAPFSTLQKLLITGKRIPSTKSIKHLDVGEKTTL